MRDYRTAPIDAATRQLLSFAEKIAQDPTQITSDDISGLRSAGFSDRAVLDAAHVAGFFCYMNRVVQALGADTRSYLAPKDNETSVAEVAPVRAARVF